MDKVLRGQVGKKFLLRMLVIVYSLLCRPLIPSKSPVVKALKKFRILPSSTLSGWFLMRLSSNVGMSPEKRVMSLLTKARATSLSILVETCHDKGMEVTRRGRAKRPNVTKRIMMVVSQDDLGLSCLMKSLTTNIIYRNLGWTGELTKRLL